MKFLCPHEDGSKTEMVFMSGGKVESPEDSSMWNRRVELFCPTCKSYGLITRVEFGVETKCHHCGNLFRVGVPNCTTRDEAVSYVSRFNPFVTSHYCPACTAFVTTKILPSDDIRMVFMRVKES